MKLDDTGADGLIPIRTLGNEYFNYDEARHALVGTRSGAMHRLGDVVDVRLVEAAPVAGALRFELLSEGKRCTRSSGQSRPTRGIGRDGRSARQCAPRRITKTKQRKTAQAKAKRKPGSQGQSPASRERGKPWKP